MRGPRSSLEGMVGVVVDFEEVAVVAEWGFDDDGAVDWALLGAAEVECGLRERYGGWEWNSKGD